MKSDLSRVTMMELELFLDVAKIGSIREVARSHSMEAAQLSRLLKRFEERIGKRLFARSSSGVTLTPDGVETKGSVENALLHLSSLNLQSQRKRGPKGAFAIKGLGAAPFIAQFIAAPVCASLFRQNRISSAQVAEIPPDRLVMSGLQGHISIAFHMSELGWPKSWVSEKVGRVRWGLFVSRRFFSKPELSTEEISRIPFAYPVYWSPEGLRDGNDSFPLGLRFREKAIGVTSAVSAINAIKEAPVVAFVPTLVARTIAPDDVFEVNVERFQGYSEDLLISAHAADVTASGLKALVDETKKILG